MSDPHPGGRAASAGGVTSALGWVLAALYPAAALLLVVLSGIGLFRSMATFPLICGGVMALFGLVELVRLRRRWKSAPAALAAAGMVLSLAAPAAQAVYLHLDRLRVEGEAMARLAGRPAAQLATDFRFNAGADEEGTEPGPGRLTVVNFWATWCQPCIEEMPMLAAWAGDHDPSRVRVVGFTRLYGDVEDEAAVARELDEIEEFLQRFEVGYLNLVERGGATHEAYAVTNWPSTVLVGADGEVLDFGVGIPGTRRILATAERLAGP